MVTWQPGQLGFHPGPSDENAVIRFTAPDTGPYTLASTFTGLDRKPTTTDVHVLVNSSSIFDGIVNAFGSGPTFSTLLTLNAGDTVDFSVGFGAGGFANDTTGLAATLTAVLVPSTLLLVLLGLGWALCRKEKQQAS